MDVKISFLNDVVEKEVYVEQPLEFETHEKETHVCKLKKALYSLKYPSCGTTKFMDFYPVWALPKVKQIPTFTTRLKMATQ